MKRKSIFIIPIALITWAIACTAQAQTGIKIEDFKTEVAGNKVVINWTSSQAEISNYFEIEKSTDGRQFKTIALVLGPDPRKGGSQFGYYDQKAKRGATSYYRLKHIAPDGTSQYSTINTVRTQ